MDYFEAIKRLANHANKPMNEDISPEESIIFNLWLANKSKKFPNIEQLIIDILNCLEIINKYINGSSPSKTVNKKMLDIELILSISLIISALQEYVLIWQNHSLFEEDKLKKLIDASWEISQAWCAILHGDIDSIKNEIILQRQTKGI